MLLISIENNVYEHDIAQYLTNSALSMQIEILYKSYEQCLIML